MADRLANHLIRVFVIAAWAASLAPARAEEAETIRLAVGQTALIALQENPSTGYRWELSGSASRNLSLVDISDAGFARGASRLLGAPGTRRFKIVAREPGTALAVFDYARPWERVEPARHHVVTIEIGRR
jgi:inhibitor of cysteine peptidase